MAKACTAKPKRKRKKPEREHNTRATMGMILFLSAAFFVFTSLLGDKSLFQLHKLQLEKARRVEENARQKEENKTLRKNILAAREDLFIVEKIAREDLGMVKENDVVYLFDPGKIREAGE
jgi:cell division protein FtsB